MKCPVCKENFVLSYSLQEHLMKDHVKTDDPFHPDVERHMSHVKGAKPRTFDQTLMEIVPSQRDSETLKSVKTPVLITELLGRTSGILRMGMDLRDTHDLILDAMCKFDEHAQAAKTTVKQAADDTARLAKQSTVAAEEQLKAIAEATRKDCQNLTKATETVCLERVQALEAECLKRVKAAEDICQKTIETVTAECNQRADAAEAEALRCMEEADKATTAANTLGQSFNLLNDKLHNLEISIRTLFAGGAGLGHAPVYTPQPTSQQPATHVTVVTSPPPPPPTPVAAPSAPAPVYRNGSGTKPKMSFVLLGLHQKNIQHITQRLRKPTARAVDITVIEDTSREVLPKDADYAIVAGGSVMDKRWHLCLDMYGPTRCIRLETGSVVDYREKIEELFEARYPFNHPNTPINSMAATLNKAARAVG